MSLDLTWSVDFEAVVLYAADLKRRGIPLADSRLDTALDEPARQLIQRLETTGMTGEQVRQHLVPLTRQADAREHLAELLVKKTLASGSWPIHVGPIAAAMAEATHAAADLQSTIEQELTRRVATLKARCAPTAESLLAGIGQLTDPALIVDRAEVLLVPPLSADQRGVPRGGGTAYLLYNSLSFEAVETDPDATLPEPLRLAWLVAQLNADLPVFTERIPRDAIPLLGALAMLPATLAAGEQAERCRCDPPTVRKALRQWDIVGRDAPDLTEPLFDWWATYRETYPPIPVAIGALMTMLE